MDWTAKGHYSTHLFAQRAVRIVQKHDVTKPLFLYLSFQAVHGPLQVGRVVLGHWVCVCVCVCVCVGGWWWWWWWLPSTSLPGIYLHYMRPSSKMIHSHSNSYFLSEGFYFSPHTKSYYIAICYSFTGL